jgi:hypothetical protein
MSNYIVNFTDVNISPITISEGDIDILSTDISLFGRIRLEYGELLNENLLHLLENFSCSENIDNPNHPNLSLTHNNLLANPVKGQFWHNSTNGLLYQYDGTYWIPIRGLEDVGANWGSISHGQQLPRPVSPTTGYVFSYEECIWSVSPGAYDGAFQGMICSTNTDAVVTMEYQFIGGTEGISGLANYLIIGIRGNENNGSLLPIPSLPVTPTPSPTVGTSPSVTPTTSPIPPTPTPTFIPPTPSATVTPSPTIFELGERTRLYVSPAVCDPGTPGPGGTIIEIHDTCGQISKNTFDQSMYVSIQKLNGGVPPYTVDFSNVIAEILYSGEELVQINESDPLYPGSIPYQYNNNGGISYVLPSYSGGNGTSTNPVRTGLVEGEITYTRLRYISGTFYNGFDWLAGMRMWGNIVVTDSVGSTKTWWIPSIDEFINSIGAPGCPLGGTNITTTPPVTLYWSQTWNHYGIGGNFGCDNCINCII